MCEDILTPSTLCVSLNAAGLCTTESIKRLCQQSCNLCGKFNII